MTKYKQVNGIKIELTAEEITALETAQTTAQTEMNTEKQELKDAEADKETKKASGKQKLLDLGLTEEEVKALIGV
jgi:hypothetical protein